MRRVMIWGWFGFENLGDDLLLRTMLSFLGKAGTKALIDKTNE